MTYKKHRFIFIITSGIIIIFLISHIYIYGSSIYNTYKTLSSSQISNTSDIYLSIKEEKTLGTLLALKNNNIAQAIDSIPQNTAQDHYNIGTLKALLAQQLISENKNDESEQLLQEAQTHFNIAIQKTSNIHFIDKIKHNFTISQKLSNSQKINICFQDFGYLLEDLESISSIIDHIDQISENIKSNIDGNISQNQEEEICLQEIKSQISQTQTYLNQQKNRITIQKNTFVGIQDNYTENPLLCLDTNIKPLLQDSQKTQIDLLELGQTYGIINIAIQSSDIELLQNICENRQNDSFSQNQSSQSIEQLLQHLENTQEEDILEQETPQQDIKAGQDIQYIPLDEEQELFNKIYLQNKKRIQNISEIKKRGYNPQDMIKTLFQEFYGNIENPIQTP